MSAKRSDALLHKRENGYRSLSAEEKAAMNAYCEDYKTFLDKSRTEREAVRYTVQLAEARGYRPYHRGEALKPGDKIYRVNRDKAIMLAVMGSESLDKGVNIGAAHIDAPRLDLKPNPLIEDSEFALLKTHYYGGIRKYHWVSIPLSLHGVVVANGTVPRCTVRHRRRAWRPPADHPRPAAPPGRTSRPRNLCGEAIKGEDLNILVGSQPVPRPGREATRCKLMVTGHPEPEVRHGGGGLYFRRTVMPCPPITAGGCGLGPLHDRLLRPGRPGVQLCRLAGAV